MICGGVTMFGGGGTSAELRYFDAGNSGTEKTVSLTQSKSYQRLTLTGNCTITLSAAPPGLYCLQLVQDSIGSRTPTFTGADIHWSDATEPVWSATGLRTDTILFVSDGTRFNELARAMNQSVYLPLSSYLLSYWQFSADATDETSNDRDLTAVGTPTYSAGKLNNAVSLNGSTQYLYRSLSTPDSFNVCKLSAFSFAAWVYPTALSASSHNVVVAFSTSDSTLAQIRYRATAGDSRYKWEFTIYDGASSWTPAYEPTHTPAINKWVFLVGVFESGSAAKLYIDGTLASVTGATAFHNTAADRMSVGATHIASSQRYFQGLIDDVAIFNKALSQEEVNELYNAGNGTEVF